MEKLAMQYLVLVFRSLHTDGCAYSHQHIDEMLNKQVAVQCLNLSWCGRTSGRLDHHPKLNSSHRRS